MLSQIKNILSSRKFYLSLAGVFGAGMLFLVLINEVIMPAYTNYDEGVTVPDITQVSLEEAEERLTAYGLRFEIAERRSNSAMPADYVIDQTPSAAKIVKPNRKIYLTVNTTSNPTVEVPDVVNLSKRNAEIQLQNNGLRVGTISYESSRFRNVIRQSVKPGDIVPEGTVVDLTVSDGLGQKSVDMPEILGDRLSEAQQKLQEAGLRVGEIRFKPTKEVSPNIILDFDPKNDEISEGEEIRLIVSERYDAQEESESGAVSVDTSYVEEPDSLNEDEDEDNE